MKKRLALTMTLLLMTTNKLWGLTERFGENSRSSTEIAWDNFRSNPPAFWTVIIMSAVVVFGLAVFIVNCKRYQLQVKETRKREQDVLDTARTGTETSNKNAHEPANAGHGK